MYMWFKIHWFWLALGAIVVSWMGNYIYFESRQLEHPILLRHYIEQTIEETTYLTLYYISNKNDYTNIQMITIDGVSVYPQDNTSFFIENTPQQAFHQEFNHHYLKQTMIEIPKDMLSEQQLKAGIDVEEIDVVFSNNDSLKMPIGHIRLMPNDSIDGPLTQISNSGGNDGVYQSVLQAKESLKMDEFVMPFEDALSKDISITVETNNQKYIMDSKNDVSNSGNWPIALETNEFLRTNIKINSTGNKVINLQMKWTGKTETGKSLHTYLLANKFPYLSQKDVNSYVLEAKGGN
jgi:hypothetical protein